MTGSWSKGRTEYYAYYRCRPGCRAVNVTKTQLEGLFADELALLQPSPGYMRLLKKSVLQIWKARKAEMRMEQRGVTEVDLRAMLERATGFDPNVVNGRFMIHVRHKQRPGSSSSSPTWTRSYSSS